MRACLLHAVHLLSISFYVVSVPVFQVPSRTPGRDSIRPYFVDRSGTEKPNSVSHEQDARENSFQTDARQQTLSMAGESQQYIERL